jgi:HPt (histidine-containing phosphotransfer) domain-containing protein
VVTTFSDHEVVVPENTLKVAISIGGSASVAADMVARAEAALEQLSNQFPAWMEQECERLSRMRGNMRKHGTTRSTREDLFRVAHDLKGQAATLGFPLAAEAADSLCRLLEHSPDTSRLPLALIDQHVDAIRAIAREASVGPAETLAQTLCERLRQVTDDFLIVVNKHRPDYLQGLVASSRLSETGSA